MINTHGTAFKNRLRSYRETLTKWLKDDSRSPSSKTTIRLGIWGTKSSGKTTYLAMLYDALELSNKWQVTVDKKARNFVQTHLETIRENLEFPEPTEKSETLEIFSYTLNPDPSSVNSSTIVLNFIDAPGEFYEHILEASARIDNPDTQAYGEEDGSMDIVDYLINCDGIIFLLDPVRSKEDGKKYSTLLRTLFQEFQERSQRSGATSGRLEQYMAFCVTKVDREELWSKGYKSDELAQKVGLELARVKNFCWLELDREKRRNRISKENRCEFFSVSSIGRYQDENEEWHEAVVYPTEKSSPSPEVTTSPSATSQNLKRGFEFGDFTSSESTDTNSSNSSSSNWASGNNKENKPASSSKLKPTIKPDVTLISHNVLEPIEWLIRAIQYHPPSRPNPSSLSNQN
ncbi:MAG: hypothetical protein SAK29_12165 [Scytonema sp. PMC 1069.18]|nr:hypothetical protein [Scytonema sp. PMC 1069.18]MEC4886848.1 hypothetical protein [Scytonema sp. PMC 1070.18]